MNASAGIVRSALHGNWPVWLGLAIGAAAFVAGATANLSALAPMWGRSSWNWVAVVAFAAAAAAFLQQRSRRPVPFALVLGCALAVATFGIGAFSSVALILIACYALGARVLEWVDGGQSADVGSDACLATTVGLAVCALLMGFTAHLRVNVPVAYIALAGVSIWIGRRHVAAAWRAFVAAARDPQPMAMPLPLSAVLWFAFAMHVAYAALPERYHDALALHLVVPRALELFRFWHFDAREYTWAVQPMGANWLFAWAYVLAGEYAAKLINAMFLLLICGLLLESRVVSRRLGLLAVAVFALTPLTFIESASLFVDGTLALFVAAMGLFAARLREQPKAASIAGFALVAAGSMAVKLHGLVALIAACGALVFIGGWREFFRAGKRAHVVCVLAAAGAAWPYAYAWLATGNPVFPYFNALFKSPLFLPQNFENVLYPGGILPSDLYNLTFFGAKYLEGYDGAIGFALTLLLPAGLMFTAAAGSPKMRVMALAALLYTVLILLNTRYVRYLFPALPAFALVMVYPLSAEIGTPLRKVYLGVVVAALLLGILRIPAAGWILSQFDPTTAFSSRAKEQLLDVEVPPRRLGRIQSALGNDESRVVVFGQNIGADIRGRPLYVGWYFYRLEQLVLANATPEDAANTLAALGTTHVIFDRRDAKPEWAPWEEAARRYGRSVASTASGELFEFHPDAVPGKDVFAEQLGPWQRWEANPPLPRPPVGESAFLPPATAVSRAADLSALPENAEITLSAEHECPLPSTVRIQINWLRSDGSIIRTDAAQSKCGASAVRGSMRAARPKGARTAYFYFTNDGKADARLFGERATALSRP
jgi:hypothetical protein